MITTISKTFDFDAAHRLDRLPPEHKCHRLHGHTYRAEIRLTGRVDSIGMLVDYAEVHAWWQPIHEEIDHRCLNDIEAIGHPTTENLARWIWTEFARHAGLWFVADRQRELVVRVYESATTYAEFDGRIRTP